MGQKGLSGRTPRRVDGNDHPQIKSPLNINTAYDLLRNPKFIDESGIGTVMCSTLSIPVDKQKALSTGTVAAKDSAKIADEMIVKLGRNLNKSQMMVLEMLRSNNWERPMYVASTVGTEYYPALQEYMVQEAWHTALCRLKDSANASTPNVCTTI